MFECRLVSFCAKEAPFLFRVDCYTGRGTDYRGTAAGPPSCLPWKELDYVQSNLTFDPLTFLSPSLLPPEALNPLPANHSVCRNPLGLAAKPFCIGLSISTNRLEIFDCPLLVDCADVDSTTLTPNHVTLLKKQQRIKVRYRLGLSFCSMAWNWLEGLFPP